MVQEEIKAKGGEEEKYEASINDEAENEQKTPRIVRVLEKGMWELKRDPEFEALLTPLDDEEYAGLKNGIQRDGCTDSLHTWNGVIVDGHNRYNICWELGSPFEVTELEFRNRDEAILWIIERQIGRRNVPPYLKAELLERAEQIQAEKAQKRKLAGKRYENHMSTLTYAKPQDRTTRHKIAKMVGVSDGTMHKINALKKKGDEETKKKLRNGEMTINKAYTELRKREKCEKGEAADEDAPSIGSDDPEREDKKRGEKHTRIEADPLIMKTEQDKSSTELKSNTEEEIKPITEVIASCEGSECPGGSESIEGSAVPSKKGNTVSELNDTEYSFDRITKYPGITVLDHPIEVPTDRRNPHQGPRDFLFVQGQVHYALKNMVKEMEVGLKWIRDDDKKRIPELREMFRRTCAQVEHLLNETENDGGETGE